MRGGPIYDLKRLTAGIIVLVMSLLMVNRALYIHIHLLPDGSVLSHAHPFSKTTDKAEGKDHRHSGLEFFLLEQLDLLTLCASALLVLKAFSRSRTFGIPARSHLLPSLVAVPPGRAPPTCM